MTTGELKEIHVKDQAHGINQLNYLLHQKRSHQEKAAVGWLFLTNKKTESPPTDTTLMSGTCCCKKCDIRLIIRGTKTTVVSLE